MAKRYRVTLTAAERAALGDMISRGKADARKLAHARVLLQADASEGGPDWTDRRIAEAVRVSVRTIERVRQRFVEDGLEAALLPRPIVLCRARRQRGTHLADQLLAALVQADHRTLWVMRAMVDLQHVFHVEHERGRVLGRDAPHPPQVRLERILF